MLVLTRERDQITQGFGEHPKRHGDTVQEATVLPHTGESARDHEFPSLEVEQVPGVCGHLRKLRFGEIKNTLNESLLAQFANKPVARALPKEEPKGLSQEGLAGARFAAQDRESWAELQRSVLDKNVILDAEG